MPIRAENRWLYPIDWAQLSGAIRFGRAGSRCERCGRPHRRRVAHLGDGRWWDADADTWRSGRGRPVAVHEPLLLARVRVTVPVLACAHLDHDPGNNAARNLAALCQRCHLLHDAAEHRWQRWWNVFRVRGLRDLFEDPRVTRARLASPRRAVWVSTRRQVDLSPVNQRTINAAASSAPSRLVSTWISGASGGS